MSFGNLDTAYAVRQAMETLSRELLGRERPEPRYGTVSQIAVQARTALVVMQGDTEPIRVRAYRRCMPTAVGDIVRVEGKPGNLYITEIVNGKSNTDGIGARDFAITTTESYTISNVARGLPRRVRGSWGFEFTHPGAGNTVTVGRWTSGVSEYGVQKSGGIVRVSIYGRGYNETSKLYEFPAHAFGVTTQNTWTKIPTVQATDQQLGNNFELEGFWDSNDYSFMLRIRSKLDYGGRGYDVVVDATGADVTLDETSTGTVTSLPAAPVGFLDTDYSGAGGTALGGSPAFFAPTRAQSLLQGGGVISWDGATLGWSQRFIVMGMAKGFLATNGYFDIAQPGSGVTIPLIGNAASTVTTTAAGIPLANWQALYYRIPYGRAYTSNNANFMIVDFATEYLDHESLAPEFVLVAVKSGDPIGPSLKLGTGREVDHWRTATLGNSWVNWGSPWASAGYRMGPGGMVQLRGFIAGGTGGSSFFTLPVGYRPGWQMMLPSFDSGTRIDVLTNGTFAPVAINYLSLDGLAFPAGG